MVAALWRSEDWIAPRKNIVDAYYQGGSLEKLEGGVDQSTHRSLRMMERMATRVIARISTVLPAMRSRDEKSVNNTTANEYGSQVAQHREGGISVSRPAKL